MPKQTLPFGIISCTLLKCACQEMVRKLVEVLKSYSSLGIRRELALLIPSFPLAQCVQPGAGNQVTSPDKHGPVHEAAQLVKYCVRSSFGWG